MLVRGLNDTARTLEAIAGVLEQIQPDAVHINLPTRLPAEPWVRPTDGEGLRRALAIFGNIAEVVHPAEGSFELSEHEDIVHAILDIITRHPMRQEELERALARWSPGLVKTALDELESSVQAQVVKRYGRKFWSEKQAHYAQ